MAFSPNGPQFCVQNDVELACGGVQVLAQLLDKNGDGIADTDLVASVIGRASAEVCAAIANQVTISTLVSPYPDVLVYTTADIAQYYSWLQGSAEIVVPDAARKKYEDALRFLDQVSTRTRTLGVSTPPASSIEAKTINVDPNNVGITRNTTQGFW